MLGSGKGLSPAAATQSQGNSSLVSPSESSVSLISSASTSHLSTDAEDLSSRTVQAHGEEVSASTAAAASKLFCPICNEEMVSSLSCGEESIAHEQIGYIATTQQASI